jgi:trigger factor
LDKVADDNQLDVDQNDLTQHIIRKAQQEGTSPNQIAEHLQEHPHHIQEYMLEIRRGKALALLVEAATVNDSNGGLVDLRGLQPDGSLAVEAAGTDGSESPEADSPAESTEEEPERSEQSEQSQS